jgi:hypothetical protein
MTHSTSARLAGFGYLSYMLVGILNEVLMYRATSVEGTAAKLARIAEFSTDVRLAMILKLAECFSAFVLAVALYGITRDEDNELAMLRLSLRRPRKFASGVPQTAWGLSPDSLEAFAPEQHREEREDNTERNF